MSSSHQGGANGLHQVNADSNLEAMLSLGFSAKCSEHTEASFHLPRACGTPKSCPRKTEIQANTGCLLQTEGWAVGMSGGISWSQQDEMSRVHQASVD